MGKSEPGMACELAPVQAGRVAIRLTHNRGSCKGAPTCILCRTAGHFCQGALGRTLLPDPTVQPPPALPPLASPTSASDRGSTLPCCPQCCKDSRLLHRKPTGRVTRLDIESIYEKVRLMQLMGSPAIHTKCRTHTTHSRVVVVAPGNSVENRTSTVKPAESKGIGFNEFQSALAMIAEKKKVAVEEVEECVNKASPAALAPRMVSLQPGIQADAPHKQTGIQADAPHKRQLAAFSPDGRQHAKMNMNTCTLQGCGNPESD
eukprot:365559-Chlamydomonas_euryale.AAC.2